MLCAQEKVAGTWKEEGNWGVCFGLPRGLPSEIFVSERTFENFSRCPDKMGSSKPQGWGMGPRQFSLSHS